MQQAMLCERAEWTEECDREEETKAAAFPFTVAPAFLLSFALAWLSSVPPASTDHPSAYSQLQTLRPAIDTHA